MTNDQIEHYNNIQLTPEHWGFMALTPPYVVKNLSMKFDSQKHFMNGLLTRSLTEHINCLLTHVVCCMHYKQYSYNRVSWRRNVMRKIVREEPCTVLDTLIEKRSTCKWTCAVPTHAAPGSSTR